VFSRAFSSLFLNEARRPGRSLIRRCLPHPEQSLPVGVTFPISWWYCRLCAGPVRLFPATTDCRSFFLLMATPQLRGQNHQKKESRVMEQLSLEKVWSMGVNRRGIQTSSLKNFQKRAYPEDRRGVHCIFFCFSVKRGVRDGPT